MCRDNDQEPIDVEDALCQRILRAAEDTAYTDNPPTPRLESSPEESSTQGRATTSPDSEVGVSHIAEQEVLSDYNIFNHNTEGGMAGGLEEMGQGDVTIEGSRHLRSNMGKMDGSNASNNKNIEEDGSSRIQVNLREDNRDSLLRNNSDSTGASACVVQMENETDSSRHGASRFSQHRHNDAKDEVELEPLNSAAKAPTSGHH